MRSSKLRMSTKKRKRRDAMVSENAGNLDDITNLLGELDVEEAVTETDADVDLEQLIQELDETQESRTSVATPNLQSRSSQVSILDSSDDEDQVRDPHKSLLETLHGSVNEFPLPPRVVPNGDACSGQDKAHRLDAIEPAPIEMSVLLPEEDQCEINSSRLVHEGGRSMNKTSNRIERGMQERTTRAHDASPAQTERVVRQWTEENRFGDHQSSELFTAAHTIRGVHSMPQPAVRRLIDPVASALGAMVYDRQVQSDRRATAAGAVPPPTDVTPPHVHSTQQEMLDLDDEIDNLLRDINAYSASCNSSDASSSSSSTAASPLHASDKERVPESFFAYDAPAYARSYYTNDETMEELNRALRQMAANVQQNMTTDPLRERDNTFRGVFQPAVNNYLDRLLMQAPQPTPGQRSWEITKGVMLRHGICLSRAVFDMYLCAPGRGQRACSAGTQCLVSRLYGVQSMPPLREFDAMNLMEQMGEPECTPEALRRCYDKRSADAANGVRRNAAPMHQLCVLCIMYNIAKAHMQVLNSNTSLPCSSNGPSASQEPELTLTRLYVRVGPGEFSKQECLFPSVTQYTGMLGPVPIITLFSFQDYERREGDQTLRALRYLGHEPRQDSSVGF